MNTTPPNPTSEERVLAALAHVSALFMGTGLIVPLIVYFTQRKKSAAVRFQALQALGYQVLGMALYLATSLVISPLLTIMVTVFSLASAAANNETLLWVVFIAEFFFLALLFGLLGIYALAGVVGAVACLSGKDFRYPWYGTWLEHYLQPVKSASKSVEVANV